MPSEVRKLDDKCKFITSILLSAFVLLYVYTFLHEIGHAFIGIICGGKIHRIVLGLGAKVSITGASFNDLTASLFHAGGFLIPVIVFIAAIKFYNSEVDNLFYHCFAFLSTAWIIGSSLAWIIIPVVSIFSASPPGDDATKFMKVSNANRLIIIAGALIIDLTLIAIAVRKKLYEKYISIMKALCS